MSVFSGLSAFPPTLSDPDGELIEADFTRLLTDLTEARNDQITLDLICLLGSTGSYPYLSLAQRKRVLETGGDVVAGRLPLIVGIGALRTDHAQVLACHAAANGADGLLLAPVSYTPLTEEEVYQHYATVASATDLPLCIYNNPSTTNFTFSVTLLQRLAQIPTIHAVKMPLPADGDFAGEIAALRDATPNGFVIGYSGDWLCPEALLAGADSWFSVIAGLLPLPALKLTQAARQGDRAEVARLQQVMAPLWALFREYGSLRVIYSLAHLMSVTQAQPPRPVLPLPDSQLDRLRAALDSLQGA